MNDAWTAATTAADRMLALADAADPDAVRTLGDQLAAERDGTLRDVGLALARGAPTSDSLDAFGERRHGRYRRLVLAGAIFNARHQPETDELVGELTMSGDELWSILGGALCDVRTAWHAAGGR